MLKIYQEEIVPKLKKTIGGGSPYGVPRPEKIVVNMGVGAERSKKESLDRAKADLAIITGQEPSFRSAKKAIASFSIREGDIVGVAVTLRGKRMWDFLEKLIRVVLPRTKDFRGIPRKSLDRKGNLTIGIKEHTAFPEIDPHKVDKIRGLEVTIVMSTDDDEKSYQVLKDLGTPFRD
jgi:large subunit ribosomal protein L5